MADISHIFHGLDGEHKNTQNACEYCNADVEFKSAGSRVFSATIKHDDDCPLWMVLRQRDAQK